MGYHRNRYCFLHRNQAPGTSVDDISWMEGSWMTDDSAYYENWRITGDSITGEGLTLTQGDTTFKEELVIITEENTLVY